MGTLLTFMIHGQRFALELDLVQRVIWAVEVVPLPGQTEKVKGVVNVEEVVVPIVDIRRIVGLPEKEIELDDDIVISRSEFGPVGIVVDSTEGLCEYGDAQHVPITPAIKSYAGGVLKQEGELIVIIDPSKMIRASDLPDVTKFDLAGIM